MSILVSLALALGCKWKWDCDEEEAHVEPKHPDLEPPFYLHICWCLRWDRSRPNIWDSGKGWTRYNTSIGLFSAPRQRQVPRVHMESCPHQQHTGHPLQLHPNLQCQFYP